MKRIATLIAMLIIFAFAAYAVDDSFWNNRNSADGAKTAYQEYKKAYAASPNDYEAAWKFARAAHFYADKFIISSEQKKAIFTEGKDAAEKATKLNPNRVEGFYYFGVCLGSWGTENGIFASLFAIGPIEDSSKKAIAIDPTFSNGGPYLLLARLYHKAPGKDQKKCQEYYEKAIKLGPAGRVNYRFYAEWLIEKKNYTLAKDIVARGLAVPYDVTDKVLEDYETDQLKALDAQLKKLAP